MCNLYDMFLSYLLLLFEEGLRQDAVFLRHPSLQARRSRGRHHIAEDGPPFPAPLGTRTMDRALRHNRIIIDTCTLAHHVAESRDNRAEQAMFLVYV